MKRFKSPEQAQHILATHDQFADLFRTRTTASADPQTNQTKSSCGLGGNRKARCRLTTDEEGRLRP